MHPMVSASVGECKKRRACRGYRQARVKIVYQVWLDEVLHMLESNLVWLQGYTRPEVSSSRQD